MISNQILQSNIEGLKEITRIDLCVCDVEGKVLASTFEHAEEYESSILAFVDSPADSQVISGYQFFKVFDEHQLEYILLAKGGSDDVKDSIKIISSRTCFLIIFCSLISTTGRRNFISRQM